MKKGNVIDELVRQIEDRLTDEDSMMLIYLNGKEERVSSMLYSKNPNMLISAICEVFEGDDEDRRNNVLDMFASAMIAYSKSNPSFASSFIQIFNKVVYGLGDDFMEN